MRQEWRYEMPALSWDVNFHIFFSAISDAFFACPKMNWWRSPAGASSKIKFNDPPVLLWLYSQKKNWITLGCLAIWRNTEQVWYVQNNYFIIRYDLIKTTKWLTCNKFTSLKQLALWSSFTILSTKTFFKAYFLLFFTLKTLYTTLNVPCPIQLSIMNCFSIFEPNFAFLRLEDILNVKHLLEAKFQILCSLPQLPTIKNKLILGICFSDVDYLCT